MPRTAPEQIAEREPDLTSCADQLREQIAQDTGRLAEIDTELGDLAVGPQSRLALPEDEPRRYYLPGLTGNPAYQHMLAALTDADRPPRCRDLCLVLDTGIEATHIAGMRNRLKRLTQLRGLSRTIVLEQQVPDPFLIQLGGRQTHSWQPRAVDRRHATPP